MSRFEGIVLNQDSVHYRQEGRSLLGATARVETAGEIQRRYTATRLVLLGPLALAFKKSKDKRELYIVVEGPGYAFVVEVPPKKGAAARKFAAAVNSAASALTALDGLGPPLGWCSRSRFWCG